MLFWSFVRWSGPQASSCSGSQAVSQSVVQLNSLEISEKVECDMVLKEKRGFLVPPLCDFT